MRPFVRGFTLVLIGVAALAPTPARAEFCATAARLAGIRDAYLSLDHGSGRDRQDAAIALLSLHLPSARPVNMAETMRNAGISTSGDRLEEVLDSAARRARDVLAGAAAADARSDHDAHRDWLTGLVNATGCQMDWRETPPIAFTGGTPADDAEAQTTDTAAEVMKYLAIFLAASLAVMGAVLIRKSRVYRTGELQRMPRHAVSLPGRIDYDTADGPRQLDVRVLDLSRGGAKAAWPDAPGEGTPLALTLQGNVITASVVWRNEFFAGLLFDLHIEAETFEALTAPDARATAG
ncbi:MAG: hypothetical protein HKP35_09470 [Silicimonas sp.]|nr:hypothetical protein [Silicimonas sp.]